MDNKRFLIILFISLIFIKLFCKDDIVEGQTGGPDVWKLDSDVGRNCDDVCGDHNMGCNDGDWGINSEASMLAALEGAGVTDVNTTVCENGYFIPSHNPTEDLPLATTSGSNPGVCQYLPNGESSTCNQVVVGGVNNGGKRLCKCVPAGGDQSGGDQSGTCSTKEDSSCSLPENIDESTCIGAGSCSWISTDSTCVTRDQDNICGAEDDETGCLIAGENNGDCEWIPNNNPINNDPVRCGDEDSQYFGTLKECLKLPDEEFSSCENATPSNECTTGCIIPVLINNDITNTDVTLSSELKSMAEDLVNSCDPDEGRERQVFGVDCLRNCKDYFHNCEYKEEVRMVNGVRSIEGSYGHIEECPTNVLPDQTCDDVDWGCKVCNDGYYVGSDNLCKPHPNMWTSLFYSILVLLFFGLLVFLYIKFGAYVIKTGTKAIAKGTTQGIIAGKKSK